jgi:hypothetical protein
MGLLIVECNNDSCPTRVHVNRPKWDTKWMESGFMPHTCVITNMLLDHRINRTSTLLAQLLYTEIVESKAIEVIAIQKIVRA